MKNLFTKVFDKTFLKFIIVGLINAFVGTEDKILEEATELANVLYEETKKLLQANFEHLKAISESLLEHEVINEDKITELMKNMNSETELSTAS